MRTAPRLLLALALASGLVGSGALSGAAAPGTRAAPAAARTAGTAPAAARTAGTAEAAARTAETTEAAARTTAAAPSTSASSAIMRLPAGPPPVGVPYAIGRRIFLDGRTYDLSSWWVALGGNNHTPAGESGQFGDVDTTRGIIIWSISPHGCIDACSAFGRYLPGGVPKRLGYFNANSGLATTTGGLISSSLTGLFHREMPIYTTAGTRYDPPFVVENSYPQPLYDGTVQGVGGSFVFQSQQTLLDGPDHSFRMYPGYPPLRLPFDNTYGVGKGTGWLATADSYRGSCYRTAAYATPSTLRARICSQTLPMLSHDGTKAVVVQGRHVRLYDALTGTQIVATGIPTLPGWDATHSFSLVGWESTTSYLVNAVDGTSLFLLRCNLAGSCQRAVNSYVREGVTRVVS